MDRYALRKRRRVSREDKHGRHTSRSALLASMKSKAHNSRSTDLVVLLTLASIGLCVSIGLKASAKGIRH